MKIHISDTLSNVIFIKQSFAAMCCHCHCNNMRLSKLFVCFCMIYILLQNMISLGIMLYEHTIRIKSLEGLASLL